MSGHHSIGSGRLAAKIKAEGAELTSLCGPDGLEYLWQAGPEWPRHAPVLFPIVGRLAGDTLLHRGRSYRLTQHGFARDSLFTSVEATADRATFRLADSDATRASYPFPFVLEMIYAAAESTLSVTTRVTNPGEDVLPCGVGAHPAFRWPLTAGASKEAYSLEFEKPETGSVRGLEGGLLAHELPSPIRDRVLALSPGLFANDALVMPDVASRSVRFSAPAPVDGRPAPALTVSWTGYKDLGLWSKPTGASFLCIEPWFGMTSPADWSGEFADKPGILLLPPGETRDFTWRATIE